MKNIFLYIVLLSLFFFGCKSTDNVANPETTESQDAVHFDEVLPVEVESDLQENDSFLEEDKSLTQEDVETFITEQGDLPLPFYDEFVPISDNSDAVVDSDKFYYGDEFVPEETSEQTQLTEQTEQTEQVLPSDEQLVNSDEISFDEENTDSNQILFDEQNPIVKKIESADDLNLEENFYPEIFDDTTESSKVSSPNDFVSQIELTDDKELVEKIIDSVNPLEYEESVIVDDILNKKDDVKSESVATNKISDKILPENKISSQNYDSGEKYPQENFNEKTTSVEKDLFENFSTSKPVVALEDLEKDIVPSRTVYASKNQMIIASYPGNGWVYLGEIESNALVGFKGKTFSSNKTNFKLQPQKEGRTILHFYKLDAINGNYIDDYLEVIVSPNTDYSVANTVNAPEFNYDYYLMSDFNKNLSDNKSESENANEVGQDLITENTISSTNDDNSLQDFSTNTSSDTKQKDKFQENESIEEIQPAIVKELAEVEVVEEEPELLFMSDIFDEEETILAGNSEVGDSSMSFSDDLDLLEQAKKTYGEKDYSKALSFVNKFLETSNSSIDEALYLKGQILEKPFEQRNIRDALECYKLVISAYPQSDLWDKCDERIKYIQRFYFNIR